MFSPPNFADTHGEGNASGREGPSLKWEDLDSSCSIATGSYSVSKQLIHFLNFILSDYRMGIMQNTLNVIRNKWDEIHEKSIIEAQ